MARRLSKVENWEQVAQKAKFRPADMAALCRVSLRQLERYFWQHFHQTPREWMRHTRCRLAIELLEEGFLNKAVARELHYGNESQLCHDFRKVYGKSPQEVVAAYAAKPTGGSVPFSPAATALM
jgi:transcriptional regulator GlxA family with amidase domain